MKRIPKDEWIIVPDMHEPIVSDEIFEAAHTSLQSRLKTVNKNTAGNRNNLFVCGYCGRRLQRSNGKITHLYCMKAKSDRESDCASLHEDLELLKTNTLKAVQHFSAMLLQKQTVVLMQKQEEVPVTEKKIAGLRSQIKHLKNSKYDLYEEYRSGRLTKEQFKKVQQENENTVERLSEQLRQYESNLEKLMVQRQQILPMQESTSQIERLKTYDPDVIGKLVEQIRVYPGGRIEIDWNCKDHFIETCVPAVTALNA